MTRKQIILIIGGGIALFFAFVLLKSVFGGKNKPDEGWREAVKAYKEQVQYIRERATADSLHAEQDLQREREIFDEKEELLKLNQAKYKPLNQKYEATPYIVRSFSNDSLARAAYETARN